MDISAVEGDMLMIPIFDSICEEKVVNGTEVDEFEISEHQKHDHLDAHWSERSFTNDPEIARDEDDEGGEGQFGTDNYETTAKEHPFAKSSLQDRKSVGPLFWTNYATLVKQIELLLPH